MADLQTTYMGTRLRNPVMVSSNGLTGSVDGVRRCYDAGAGAVVLKSLFEEIIVSESEGLDRELLVSEHPEAYEYMRAELGMQIGPLPYLRFVEDVRKKVDIPVFASVNCTSGKWWVSYARDLESAGADGIELNISHFPQNAEEDARGIEQKYIEIVQSVKSRVSIPIAVKVGFYFTSLWNELMELAGAGADALVLFNRYYNIDVDIETRKFVPAMTFSSPQEMSIPLRWVGLCSRELDCDISASTGVHDAEGVIKMLLAGATTVQLCSAIYLNDTGYLAEIIEDLDGYLERLSCGCVDNIRGAAHENTGKDDVLLQRMQYLKALNEAAKYSI